MSSVHALLVPSSEPENTLSNPTRRIVASSSPLPPHTHLADTSLRLCFQPKPAVAWWPPLTIYPRLAVPPKSPSKLLRHHGLPYPRDRGPPHPGPCSRHPPQSMSSVSSSPLLRMYLPQTLTPCHPCSSKSSSPRAKSPKPSVWVT